MLMIENTTNTTRELSLEEKKKASSKQYRDAHKAEKKARDKAWRETNKEKRKRQATEWRKNNKEAVKQNRRKRYKERYQPNSIYAITERIRAAVRRSFQRISQGKPADTLALLGCTWGEAKAHFESLFLEGMSWDNYGKGGWHIDHIRPVSSFAPEEIHQMNNISNLQPLWWYDNLSKSNKWGG